MQNIDIAREVAEQALMLIAHHVPTHIPIGRPHVAVPDHERDDTVRVLTDSGLWWVREEEVDRLDELGDGLVELVTFQNGKETDRVIARIDYDQL